MGLPLTTILARVELASALSKRNAASLEMFSNASQVRAWTRRSVAKYKKYISALLAIHNSIAPIDKLPTEILQEIFAHISSEYHGSWLDPHRLLSLQSVCHRWRSVLLATPEYWVRGIADVVELYAERALFDPDTEYGRTDRSLLDLFLARSMPCPFKLQDYSSRHRRPGRKASDLQQGQCL